MTPDQIAAARTLATQVAAYRGRTVPPNLSIALADTVLALLAERPDMEALDVKWKVASEFIRDVIDAVGLSQPEPEGFIDLPALTLQVIGQIEEGKARVARLEAVIELMMQVFYDTVNDRTFTVDEKNALEAATAALAAGGTE